MNDWLIIGKLGPTEVYVARDCTREQAIQRWENEANQEYEEDMDGDYVIVKPIPKGDCVRIDVDGDIED